MGTLQDGERRDSNSARQSGKGKKGVTDHGVSVLRPETGEMPEPLDARKDVDNTTVLPYRAPDAVVDLPEEFDWRSDARAQNCPSLKDCLAA